MADDGAPLVLHPDRLLAADPAVRTIARRLYDAVRDEPLISPHGHVDAQLLVDDEPFADPVSLLVTPDHYVTRLLHARGIPLDALGVGEGRLDDRDARDVWRLLCRHWDVFRGTPVKTWMEAELVELFGVDRRPSIDAADAIYDQIAARLAEPAYRPRALYERFRLDVLATTDDPCSDLAAHAALRADPTWPGRVIPTFRPDRYLEAGWPTWADDVGRLGRAAGVEVGDLASLRLAFQQRREHFIAHGATSADHSHVDVGTDRLDRGVADDLVRRALDGEVSEAEGTALRRHLLFEMAALSVDDGLTMTIHPGVRRNHHAPTAARFGPDTGHDLPLPISYTDGLRPLLEAFGTADGFHLVLFTLDETVWSRELAPLAGFYPSVFVGVPWWFLDAPDAMRRFREATYETAGFTRTSGFIDDTRAYCSIPARHDVSRRVDAGVLARLVAEHRLDEDEALDVAVDLVTRQPAHVFKL